MKKLLIVASAAAVAACRDVAAPASGAVDAGPPAVVPAAIVPEIVPGRYLVRFSNEVRQPIPAIAAKIRASGGRLVMPVVGEAFRGFAVELSADGVVALQRDPDIDGIEPDRVIRGTSEQGSAPWGLDRADQRELPLTGSYGYDVAGAGVTVYVFDSGINYAHGEFGRRAVKGIDFATPSGSAADCNGHGSHVAGIVAGRTYGVAKEAKVVSVRVLDCLMKGTMLYAINGLNWVTAQKRATPATPMVVNLSVDAASASLLFDQAINNAIRAGVTVVVAAGNTGRDACLTSPSRVPNAITVAASDAGDRLAAYSNRGRCVDLVAPGSAIPSASAGSTSATAVKSGTSMAAPHVAGAAALYLSANPRATPAQVAAALTGSATAGAIGNLPDDTADRLLYTGFLRAPE